MLLLWPSPKFHNRLATDPVELSEKWTVRGAVPKVESALKHAAGAGSETMMYFGRVLVSKPPGPETVNTTEKVSAVSYV